MHTERNVNHARLLIKCTEKLDIISDVSKLLLEYKANIRQVEQHTIDPQGDIFFIRIEFDLEYGGSLFSKIVKGLHLVSENYPMDWRLSSNHLGF